MILRTSINVFLFVFLLAFAACQSPRAERALRDIPVGPAYKPENVFAVERLPPGIQRVAVLPFAPIGTGGASLEDLHLAFMRQLHRQGRFEVLNIEPSVLRELTGRPFLAVVDDFPVDLLVVLRERYRADAVMLTDITAYRPYKPMVIGVRAKLFESEGYAVLWACDEIVDAGLSTVNTGARRYARANVKQNYPMQSTGSILQSPSRFSSYTADLIYGTLPPRG